jgi:hypothetical protein
VAREDKREDKKIKHERDKDTRRTREGRAKEKDKDKDQNQYKDKTRQDKTRQDKTRQDKTRQDKTEQDKTRQDKDECKVKTKARQRHEIRQRKDLNFVSKSQIGIPPKAKERGVRQRHPFFPRSCKTKTQTTSRPPMVSRQGMLGKDETTARQDSQRQDKARQGNHKTR